MPTAPSQETHGCVYFISTCNLKSLDSLNWQNNFFFPFFFFFLKINNSWTNMSSWAWFSFRGGGSHTWEQLMQRNWEHMLFYVWQLAIVGIKMFQTCNYLILAWAWATAKIWFLWRYCSPLINGTSVCYCTFE